MIKKTTPLDLWDRCFFSPWNIAALSLMLKSILLSLGIFVHSVCWLYWDVGSLELQESGGKRLCINADTTAASWSPAGSRALGLYHSVLLSPFLRVSRYYPTAILTVYSHYCPYFTCRNTAFTAHFIVHVTLLWVWKAFCICHQRGWWKGRGTSRWEFTHLWKMPLLMNDYCIRAK